MSEILINGSWGPAQSGAEQMIHNPATLRPLGMAPFCDAQDVVSAMAAARRALEHWRTLPRETRDAYLVEVGRALSASAHGIAELQAMETGQPYFECLEAARAAARCFTELAELSPDTTSALPGANGRPPAARPLLLDRDYPLLHWACRAVPLLREGSTLVCVAPRSAPLAPLLAVRSAIALPPGVLNVLVASPETVKAALGESSIREDDGHADAGHPGCDAVFIGDGAEFPVALRGSASLRLFHSGQRAGQGARIFVAHGMSQAFTDRLHEYMAFLECGDPRNAATDLGPLRSPAVLQRVEEQVASTLKRGALLKLGGRRYQPWGLRGYFFQPTLMIEGRGDERAPDQEIQGPVVVISPVRTLAEAVSQQRVARVSCFGGDLGTEQQSLGAAGIDFRLEPASTPLERIMQRYRFPRGGPLRIEAMKAAEQSWFPYGDLVTAG